MTDQIFTANRIAAIATWLAALGALIASFEGVFSTPWQNFAIAVVAMLTKLATTLKFLTGAQRHEALAARPSQDQSESPPRPGVITAAQTDAFSPQYAGFPDEAKIA